MHVRKLEPKDAPEVARIASATPGFTVPSQYIIWMLTKTQDGLCWVAESNASHLIAYLLCIATTHPKEVFIWQLGISNNSRSFSNEGASVLCRKIVDEMRVKGYKTMRFTAIPSSEVKFLRRISQEILGCSPIMTSTVQSGNQLTGRIEAEYCLHIEGPEEDR